MFIVAAILAYLMDFRFAILARQCQMVASLGVQAAVAALILAFIAILGFQVVNQGRLHLLRTF